MAVSDKEYHTFWIADKSINTIPPGQVLMVNMLHLHIPQESINIKWYTGGKEPIRNSATGTAMDPIAIVHGEFHLRVTVHRTENTASTRGFRLIFTYHQVCTEDRIVFLKFPQCFAVRLF